MGKFVQIIEYQTSRFDEVLALGREREQNDKGSLARRVTVTADRDRPGTYLTLVEFDSAEAAAENSNRPETQAFAEQMSKLTDGPPKFYNLDVEDTFAMS
jgi:quinol monooxygenase YgiN